MLSIVFSLICSVSVGVLLKIAKNYKVVLMQIIGWNYVIALLFTQLAFSPDWQSVSVNDFPVMVLSSLWILLPIVFLFQALSLKYVGIVKTDIAQRLSLFIPILASYFLFGETFSDYKIIGLAVAFLAIFFTLYRDDSNSRGKSPKWQYPLLVLLGFGVIDVLFKKVAAYTAVPYTTSLAVVFSGALIVAWGINLYQIVNKKEVFQTSNIGWGVALGLLNFGNIYFYLKAHQELSENPSTVFATMNLGVIILGSFIGVLFFKEKLNKMNYLGIIMALVAVVLIMISQLKA
jgi:drug/metabolite transporter (DMT)-like permease